MNIYEAKMIRVDGDLYQELKKRAKADDRSLTNYTNKLIRDVLGNTPSPEKSEYENLRKEKMEALKPVAKQFVDDLLKKSEAAPLDDTELPCCKNDNQPCKHWVWDTSTGEGYHNTLSGRYREAE